MAITLRDGRTVGGLVVAVDVGRALAGEHLIVLASECSAESDVHRLRQAELELLRQVHTEIVLAAPQRTGRKRGLVGDAGIVAGAEHAVRAGSRRCREARTERRVQRVAKVEVEAVGAKVGAIVCALIDTNSDKKYTAIVCRVCRLICAILQFDSYQ